MTKNTNKLRLPGALACLLIVMFTGLRPLPALAQEYVAPSFVNILKVLVRFGALDLRDDNILNSYAMIAECKLYTHFFDDEFKWRPVQAALRKSVSQSVGGFPTSLYYNARLQLDRYDFAGKTYKFTQKSTLKGVDYFTFDASNDDYCGETQENILPLVFQVVLDQPLVMHGIPMSQEDGKTLLARMEKNNNLSRLVYTRFNMRVVFVEPLFRDKDRRGNPVGRLRQQGDSTTVRLDAHLGSIDFFEDEARTKLIYSYRP